MKRLFLFVMAACATLLVSCANDPNPVVKVDGGSVQGILEDDVLIYKGIPFAAPPVGELRGKLLQPVQPWEGVLEADAFRAAAAQAVKTADDPIWYKEFYADGQPEYKGRTVVPDTKVHQLIKP